jgi:hypothetical protein
MSDEPQPRDQREGYEAPRADDVPSEDGPAVTAAGASSDDFQGPEWRPQEQTKE